jgi:Cu+-exporting ATPase
VATDFQALPGKGVSATVNAKAIVVGSPRLMSEMGLDGGAWDSRAGELEAQGMTVVWLAEDGVLRGGIAIGDAIRAESIEAIAKLKRAGVEAIMLTGDNQAAADAIGQELAIDRVIAEVMPADKAAQVEALQEAGRCVAMVGDGVNDAPALAAADVGFAMSSGSDVAMHTAGITLMRPSPLLVADAISISRATTRKIHQNLFWAFAYNSIGIPLAALGFLSPMIAGGAMALSSVSVLSNALLLRRWRPSS